MTPIRPLLIYRVVALALLLAAGPAMAGRGGVQRELRREIRAGNVLPPREIEQRVLPTMPGIQYIGQEFDPVAMAYRLKFIHDGRVVFIDVDGRSGEVINHSQ